MCNFMGYTVSRSVFIKLLQIEKELGTLAALQQLKDGFKYGNSVVLIAKGDNDVEAKEMHWEYIPSFIRSMAELIEWRKKGIPWLNAKGENLFINDKGKKSMWADAAMKRRCLVLATHFYEWRHFKPEGAKKDIAYPYRIGAKNFEQLYMAGLWTPWTDKETGETMDTFAIVTTKGNEIMEKIHNTKKRMPVILTEELAHEWIFGKLSQERITEIGTSQFAASEMEYYTIKKDFKAALDPTEAFEFEELPAL